MAALPAPVGPQNDTLAHRDHVHASLYDHGGYLPPGLSLAMNATGKPEPVLRTGEPDVLHSAATRRIAVDGGVHIENAYAFNPREIAREAMELMRQFDALAPAW